MWSLVEAAGVEPPSKQNSFPVRVRRPDNGFRSSTADQLLGVAPAAIDLIEKMQPYALADGGDDPKETVPFVLKSFSDKDKHRQLAFSSVAAEISREALRAMLSWDDDGVLEKFIPALPEGSSLEAKTLIAQLRIVPVNPERRVYFKGQFPALVTFDDREPSAASLELVQSEEWVRWWIGQFRPFLT